MNNDLVLRNANLVLPNEVVHGSIAVAGGLIAAVDLGASQCLGASSIEGDFLIPGFIEMHTDNLERHLMPRPKVQWPVLPALIAHDAELIAAGITTVFDAIGVGDADPDALRSHDWQAFLQGFDHAVANNLLRAEHLLHVRCELPASNTLELFEPFRRHQAVRLISLMDHTIGQRQWENPEAARTYYKGKKGWSDTQFLRFAAQAEQLQQRYSLTHQQALLEHAHGLELVLASHDDTTVSHVVQAHAMGISISEFPTTLAAAQTARALALSIVMGAPNLVRGGSHSGNVAAIDLARLDLLDCLSSDYVPSSLLTAVFEMIDNADFPMAKAFACVTGNVAKMLGMHDRGLISPGMRADFVQVRVSSSPTGRRLPRVIGVWRDGVKVF